MREKSQQLFTLKVVTRFSVLKNLIDGKVSAQDAANQLRISRRQVLRLKKRIRSHGISGLGHRGIGRAAPNRLSRRTLDLILRVFDQWYARTDVGVNCAHLSDILEREHGLRVCRQTVWRLLRSQARVVPCKRVRKHRLRRERSDREGQLLFLDGSPHPWFGADRLAATLILCSDDATGKALHGLFVPHENLAGCLEVAFQVFQRYGLPSAFYLDRASQFKTTRKQYQGSGLDAPPTFWQESMSRLGIRCIFAYSPQARGRGERMNGSFQGRLAAELQFKKIRRIHEANRYLNEVFIPDYNSRFSVQPKIASCSWRPLPAGIDSRAILAGARVSRHVDRDNTFHFEGIHYQVLPHEKAPTLATTEITVSKAFDGSVHAEHHRLGPLRIQPTEPAPRKIERNKRVTFRLQPAGDSLAAT